MTNRERRIRANISRPIRKGQGYVIHGQFDAPGGVATASESHILPDYATAMSWRTGMIWHRLAQEAAKTPVRNQLTDILATVGLTPRLNPDDN